MMYRRLFFLFALTLWVSFLLPLASADQGAPLTGEVVAQMSIEELLEAPLTVSSFFEESHLKSSASASRVSESEWRKLGARRTFDALGMVPGVISQQFFGGVDIPRIRNSRAGTGVALLVDGVSVSPYSNNISSIALSNVDLGVLDGIEVIRGPGSALYGSDALHGVIDLKPWEGKQDIFEGSAEQGSFGFERFMARGSQAIGSGLRFSAAAAMSGNTDSNISQQFTDTDSGASLAQDIDRDYSSHSAVARLAGEDLDFSYLWSDFDATNFEGRPELMGSNLNGAQDGSSTHASVFSGRYTLKFDSQLSLETRGNFSSSHRYLRQGTLVGPLIDGSPDDVFGMGSQRGGGSATLRYDLPDLGSRFVLGYSFDSFEITKGTFQRGSGPELTTGGHGLSRELHSIFAQTESRVLDDSLGLLAGFRLDQYSDFGGHISPRFSAVYNPTEETALKFIYGHAFRAPSGDEQGSFPGFVKGGGCSLSPEKLNSYEVVAAYQSGKSTANISGFLSLDHDGIAVVQNNDPAIDFPFMYVNSAKSRVYGVESEAGTDFDVFAVRLSGSYTIGAQTEPFDSRLDYRAFPRWIFNVLVDVPIPSSNITVSVVNRIFTEQVSRQNEASLSFQNQELPDFWRTDVHVSWRPEMERWHPEVFFDVRNLFDRDEVTASFVGLERGLVEPGVSAVAGLKVSI